MIYELKANEFTRAQPLFAGLENRVAIQAIIEGNSPGRIFVDDATRPTAAFMWNEFRYSYLAGNPNNDAFTASLSRLLSGILFPEARDSHDPTVVLYPHPETWREKVDALIGGETLINLARRTFSFNPARFQYRGWRERVPSGFRVQRIDESLLEKGGQEIIADIRTLWRSADDFLSAGAGFCLLSGNQVVSTCLSGFFGGGKYEIGVSTSSEHRRQGFATLTASAFIAHCLQQDLEPVWECWADNSSSIGLAEKLGFEMRVDYPVYFVDLTKRHPRQ